MKPRVLLVVLPYVVKNIDATRPKLRSFAAFPYGVLSMATYCKDLAEIEILDLNTVDDDTISPEQYVELAVELMKPHLVGFSMMFDISYRHLGACLKKVKGISRSILTLLGGAAASYSYREILDEQPNLDAICYSEGEIPMKRLLSEGYRHAFCHPSWISRESLAAGIIPEISFIEDLDDVIDLDYSMVETDVYDMQEAFSPFADHHKKHKQFFLVTSRGCPFRCRFCSNSAIHGKTIRYASVGEIIEHVHRLVHDYGMDVLTIYDDQLLLDKLRAKELFAQLAQFRLRIEMPNGLSPAFIDQGMAYLMRKAGVDTVYLAIEHGSEYVLKEIIRKPLKLWMVKPVVAILRAEGFFIHGFFVIGMPGETAAHRRETVEFIKDIGIDWAGLNAATPVRGSELYEQCLRNGWIKKQRIDEIEDKRYIINAPEIGLTPEIIEKELDWMNLDVNFHNNYRMKIGDYATAAACFREVLRRYSGHERAKKYLAICEERMGS